MSKVTKYIFGFIVLFIVSTMSLCLLPKTAYSQEKLPEPSHGKITSLEEGEKAPFAGILLSPPAFASIKAQIEREYKMKIFKLKKEKALQEAKYEFKLQVKDDKIKALQSDNKEIRKEKQNYIDKLEKRATQKNLTILYFTGGVLLGGVTVFASVKLGQKLVKVQ